MVDNFLHASKVFASMLVQVQKDLDRLDGGASAYIYAVNHDVVLKAPVTFVQPSDDSSAIEQYEYALNTVCHHEDIENERTILRRLAESPHTNIVQAITLDHPEGVYLRRYVPLSKRLQTGKPTQSIRITWYRDILRALVHLHKLDIAHADVRLDNFLCQAKGAVVLCDFTCSRSFGQENPSVTDSLEDLAVNGASRKVSDVTDRFALASVIFEVETGTKPKLSVKNHSLHFPTVETGNEALDLIIKSGWLAEYETTLNMLWDVESLMNSCSPDGGSILNVAAVESLQAGVSDWRRRRARKYGKIHSDTVRFTVANTVVKVKYSTAFVQWKMYYH